MQVTILKQSLFSFEKSPTLNRKVGRGLQSRSLSRRYDAELEQATYLKPARPICRNPQGNLGPLVKAQKYWQALISGLMNHFTEGGQSCLFESFKPIRAHFS